MIINLPPTLGLGLWFRVARPDAPGRWRNQTAALRRPRPGPRAQARRRRTPRPSISPPVASSAQVEGSGMAEKFK